MLNLKQVHKDERGEIFVVFNDDKEIGVFLITNQGFSRGGCVHKNNDEYAVSLEGIVRYFVKDFDKPMVLYPGKVANIPRQKPHYFISDTNSIIFEYGAGVGDKDLDYKKIVDEINISNRAITRQ